MEYKVIIDGLEHGQADIRSANIKRPLFDQLSIGNACEAELKILYRPKAEAQKMAIVEPYVNEGSGWERLGVFYIDQRSTAANGITTLIAYDSMLKANLEWVPDQSLEFPMSMQTAAEEIASLMGISLDARTELNESYSVDYPANEYTLRDVLCFIATAHGGNWIITRENKLLLVPLVGSAPQETSYLVTEAGDPITFGGDRILI